jgi:polysaccharide pyruvyl transferase CsaB
MAHERGRRRERMATSGSPAAARRGERRATDGLRRGAEGASGGMGRKPENVVIAGYFGHRNAGDEAILAGMLAALGSRRPPPEIAVIGGDPRRLAREHQVVGVDCRDVAGMLEVVRAADLVLLGGGGLFHDYWESPPDTLLTADAAGLAAYLAPPVLAALSGRRCVIHAAGVGPLRTAAGQRLTRAAFELCAAASVRDHGSLECLASLGITSAGGHPIAITPDAAALLVPASAARVDRQLAEWGIVAEEPLHAVSLRHWVFAGGGDPVAACAQALAGWLVQVPGRLLLLPFHAGGPGPDEDDPAVLARLRDALPEALRRRTVTLADTLEPELLLGVVGRCSTVLAMRFHAVWFALAAGVPVVALAYDPKVRELLAGLGQQRFVLPPEAWKPAAIAAALVEVARHGPLAPPGWGAAQRELAAAGLARSLEAAEAPPPVARGEGERLLAELALDRIARVAAGEGRRWSVRRPLGPDAETADALEAVREQRDLALAERDALARRLAAIEQTVAWRVVARFWATMHAWFPPGSRRRGLYRGTRRVASALLGRRAVAERSEAAATAAADARHLAELVAFEDATRTAGTSRLVTIVSGTRLVGSEGQRPMQLARALAELGVAVVFAYWRPSGIAPAPQDRVDEGVLQLPLDFVVRHADRLGAAFRGVERILLVAFPWPGLFTTVATANAAGWITLYDVLDDWEEFHRAGQADWYDGEFERHLITACDAVFAVNANLARRVATMGGAGVEVVANGVRSDLAVVHAPRVLARGTVTVGYFGYLSPAWFDWELVIAAAHRQPDWRFYLIGYGDEPPAGLPANVVLLGRQPQRELAAFAANWDVGLVPFREGPLAAGADPIKTYEYLAMGLPVVATGVPAPEGGETMVRRVTGLEELLAAIAAAAGETSPREQAARRAFAAGCSWQQRVGQMLGAVDQGRQRVAEKRALFPGVEPSEVGAPAADPATAERGPR